MLNVLKEIYNKNSAIAEVGRPTLFTFALRRIFSKNTSYFYAVGISISLSILSEIFLQIGYFLSRLSIMTRDIDIGIMSVRPSVRLSVMFRYWMKTA